MKLKMGYVALRMICQETIKSPVGISYGAFERRRQFIVMIS